jgi:low affinity Fe/Cu permease
MEALFEKSANAIATAMGRPLTFLLCCLLVLIWGASGPMFHFSDTWQLVINTGTTIVTFLMVFLIQNSQNREGKALQAKLDELIRALDTAQNRFIGLEQRTEQEIGEMRVACQDEADVPSPDTGMTATRPGAPTRIGAV